MQNTDKGTASQDVFVGKVSVEVEHGALTADNKRHTQVKKVKRVLGKFREKGREAIDLSTGSYISLV